MDVGRGCLELKQRGRRSPAGGALGRKVGPWKETGSHRWFRWWAQHPRALALAIYHLRPVQEVLRHHRLGVWGEPGPGLEMVFAATVTVGA